MGKKVGRRKIGLRLRFRVLERCGYRCSYCHASDAALEIDHKIPVSKGGTDEESNLTTACFSCNRGKSASVGFSTWLYAQRKRDDIVGDLAREERKPLPTMQSLKGLWSYIRDKGGDDKILWAAWHAWREYRRGRPTRTVKSIQASVVTARAGIMTEGGCYYGPADTLIGSKSLPCTASNLPRSFETR